MNLSTKQLILNEIQKGQCTRDYLRKVCKEVLNRDVETVGRKCRELTEAGEIKPIQVNGFNVAYKIASTSPNTQKMPQEARRRTKPQKLDLANLPPCFTKYRATSPVCQSCEWREFCKPKIKEWVEVKEQEARLNL